MGKWMVLIGLEIKWWLIMEKIIMMGFIFFIFFVFVRGLIFYDVNICVIYYNVVIRK